MNLPKSITREAFHKICPHEGHPAVHDEKEWYQLGGVLGVVILDRVDKDWSHVVLQDEGGYKAVDMGTSAVSVEDARLALFKKMQALQHGPS